MQEIGMNGGMTGVKRRKGRSNLFGALLLATTAIVGATATPALAQNTSTARRSFDIPAQSLAQALMIFGRQSGLQVTAEGPLTSGLTSTAIKGDLPSAEALSRLLTGTGLTFRFVGNGGVILERAPQSAASAIQLGPVRVEGTAGSGGSNFDPAISEGTGTYAAQAATIGKFGAKSLRDVPQSVSVITQQQMTDQALVSVEDALQQLPGVYIGTKNSIQNDFNARGYDLAISHDGVPSGASFISSMDDLYSVDRIEVIRGPAALLRSAGLGSIGGMVNIVRKRALDHFEVNTELSAGSWNNFSGMADVTGPLNSSGSIRGRLVASIRDNDYFYEDSSRTKYSIYGALDVDITPSTKLEISASYGVDDVDGSVIGVPRYSDGRIVTSNRKLSFGPPWGTRKLKSAEITAALSQDLGGDWLAKATVSYRNEKSDYVSTVISGMVAADNTARFLGRWNKLNDDYTSFDLQVSGPIHAFGRTHKLTIGADGSWLHDNWQYSTSFPGNKDVFAAPFPKSVIDEPNYLSVSNSPQRGIYGALEVNPLERVKIIFGGRYTETYYEYADGTPNEKAPPYTRTDKYKEFTPYVGAIVDLTRTISLYASYADIFVPNFDQYSYPNSLLPPRVGWQGEIGIKGEFLDKRLNTSLAFYRVRDANRPMLDLENTGCGQYGECFVPSGLVQSQGIDAEISGYVLPGLQLSASYTYNENEYLEDDNPSAIGEQFSGMTPKHLFKFWATYQFGAQGYEQQARGWSIGAGLNAQSRVYASQTVEQGSYATVSGMAAYRFNPEMSLSVNVNNILDRKYLTGIAPAYNYYGEPRNFRVTFRARF